MPVDVSQTHFDLFGLAPSFDVDLERLDSRYRELQRTVHPDRFVNATDQERRISMQQATLINEGYLTLKDPLKRGRYLLELDGYQFNDEHHTTKDAEFLMEQMDLREALGEVPDADSPFMALGKIMDRIDDDLDELTGELRSRLQQEDQDAVAETLVKMQFFRKLQDEANELEIQLEDAQI